MSLIIDRQTILLRNDVEGISLCEIPFFCILQSDIPPASAEEEKSC